MPFGFDFDTKGHLLVSEAAASTASSYDVTATGHHTISASVATTENAACWLVASNNGTYAYTGNAGGSLSISGFRVSDLALSGNSHFLYGRLATALSRGSP